VGLHEGAIVINFSAACERNQDAILQQLAIYLATATSVLELGAGTGQHAVHFARGLGYLQWQPSERLALLPSLQARLTRDATPNLKAAIPLDVTDDRWPAGLYDAVFTANTLHIMSWSAVTQTFTGVARLLRVNNVFCCYGPFRRHGLTAPSNESFDRDLRYADPESGLRDIDDLESLARDVGLELSVDILLPANNQLLVWRRTG